MLLTTLLSSAVISGSAAVPLSLSSRSGRMLAHVLPSEAPEAAVPEAAETLPPTRATPETEVEAK